MEEITIKVPAPFAGIADLGFTAQYPSADTNVEAPRDVPLLIEGPGEAMRRLADRLAMLRAGSPSDGEARSYTWTDPIALSDQVIVIAFRDQSLRGPWLSDGARASADYVFNLVRPVAFPFLHDCARLAGLRLSERIEIRVTSAAGQVAELALRQQDIVNPNGDILLFKI